MDGRKLGKRLELLRNADQLYLSALSVVEIKAGMEKLRRAGSERRAVELMGGWSGLVTDNMRHFEPLRLSIRLLNPLRSNLPARD